MSKGITTEYYIRAFNHTFWGGKDFIYVVVRAKDGGEAIDKAFQLTNNTRDAYQIYMIKEVSA